MSRKTKIIITLGPATEAEEMIGKLIDAGTNVFRLNMSHAKHEWAAEMTKRVRRQSEARDAHIAVLFDLTGPSIRTGDLDKPYNLLEGDIVEFRKIGADQKVPLSTTVNYDGLMGDVAVGNTLVVDNGAMLMRIDVVEADRILCSVKTPGSMGSRRHINLPGVRLNLPALTEKDHKDLSLAVECGADYIAGSFVRDSAHVRELRQAMHALEGEAQIVAKVEDQEAIRNIDAIILEADVIMVARGDLGTEVEFEELPILQRRIVKRCHELGKRVIVPTQLLESMIQNPTPTRAEASDVATAIYDGADAVMLSAESAAGKYPLETVIAMSEICAAAEAAEDVELDADFSGQSFNRIDQTIAMGALFTAHHLGCKAIVALTESGSTPLWMSRHRIHIPIYALTPNITTQRKMALYRNVRPLLMDTSADRDTALEQAEGHLLRRNIVQSGDVYAITCGEPMGAPGGTNMLKICRVA